MGNNLDTQLEEDKVEERHVSPSMLRAAKRDLDIFDTAYKVIMRETRKALGAKFVIKDESEHALLEAKRDIIMLKIDNVITSRGDMSYISMLDIEEIYEINTLLFKNIKSKKGRKVNMLIQAGELLKLGEISSGEFPLLLDNTNLIYELNTQVLNSILELRKTILAFKHNSPYYFQIKARTTAIIFMALASYGVVRLIELIIRLFI